MDAICVVFEWRQLSSENLQSLQHFAVLQILQVLLLQQQELHTLRGRKRDKEDITVYKSQTQNRRMKD